MSFSLDEKNEIIKQPIKSACCKMALLSGILSSKASLDGENVKISAYSDESVSFIAKLIMDIYGKETEISRLKVGGRAKILSFRSPSAVRYVENFKNQKLPFVEKCKFCKSYYLKGVFLAAGRVSDPTKQYLLEFSLNNYEYFLNFFNGLGIDFKYAERGKENVLYIKKSSLLEDFFALAGMNGTAFHIINAKIENEIRNNVNRVANCETNNIDKAVTASHAHIVAIKKLAERGLLSSLPEELEKTANLRLQHEGLSLSALAKISVPPISKSGLSHRLNKIMELSHALLKK